MDVIVAFARVAFERIVNSTLLRLAGNVQRAVVVGWTRWVSGLALSFALCGTGHAGIEQVWEYKVSTLPGQVFPTLPAAEGAMRGVSAAASYLQKNSESISSTSVAIQYTVPTIPATPNPWVYYPPGGVSPTSCPDSEGTAISMYENVNISADPKICIFSVSAYNSWDVAGVNSSVTCNLPGQIEKVARLYKVISSTTVWDTTTQAYICSPERTGYVTFHRMRDYACPVGYVARFNGGTGICVNNSTATITGNLTQYCPDTRGNPCAPATGNKLQTEQDGSFGTLKFSRSYNSVSQLATHSKMGTGWSHNYSAHLTVVNGGLQAAIRSSGHAEPFYKRANLNNYVALTGSGLQAEANSTGWVLYQPGGEKEFYDASGTLLSLVDRAGNTTTIITDAVKKHLIQVTDPFGHSLTFGYSADDKYLRNL